MSKRRMPAEWEPQRAVQLTWPHKGTDWVSTLPDITRVYEQMAREILRREELIIVAPREFCEEWGKESPFTDESAPVTSEGAPFALHLSPFTSNDTWARDHGFITVEQEGDAAPRLLDFCFNGWGGKFEAELDNQINAHLYRQGIVRGIYEPHLDFVLEGGSIESDGQGTVFTTACCLLAPHRNQPLDIRQIERRLRQWLGAERVVWLRHGSLIGDDTDGHIDTLVRVCPNDTLLYTGADADHPDLLLMDQELQALRTLSGQPYRLLRLPLPRPIYDEGTGERLPATYANYLVVNGAVLVPTYAQSDLDGQACRTIALAYPNRDIVPINCRPVIRQHGSLHCCTMQYY